MGKHLLVATLWGFATWTWLSMAAFFAPIPDLGIVGGIFTAAAILAWSFRSPRHAAAPINTTRRVADHR